MFPGEWCTPQLAKAAAFAIEQAAVSGTTVAVGSTIQMLGVVMEVPITSSSAAKNSSGACSADSAACLLHAGTGHVSFSSRLSWPRHTPMCGGPPPRCSCCEMR